MLTKSLWMLNVAGSALVVWRLYSAGLHRTYRFFFVSMILSLARSGALLPFAPRSEIYYQIWSATQPILWLCYVLVVAELYSLVLKRYRGIHSLGRWFFFTAVATSVIISALTVFPTIVGPPANRRQVLYYYALAERGVVTGLAIFLLLLLLLVTWFPVPLSRNLLTHCCIYSAYFFSNNVVNLYWHSGGKTVGYDLARLSIGALCFLSWVFLLSRSGEERMASVRLGRSTIEEKRLLSQLENLNSTLARTARK